MLKKKKLICFIVLLIIAGIFLWWFVSWRDNLKNFNFIALVCIYLYKHLYLGDLK